MRNTLPAKAEPDIAQYKPTQKQYNAFARRIAPMIKSYFADEQIQKEFAEWQKMQNSGK